jgi:hypothetical protein
MVRSAEFDQRDRPFGFAVDDLDFAGRLGANGGREQYTR